VLRSAEVIRTVRAAAEFGVSVAAAPQVDFAAVVARSREVVRTMRGGIEFLLKKHNITMIAGLGKLTPSESPAHHTLAVQKPDGTAETVAAQRVIIATGARPRSIAAFPTDEERIISSSKALIINELPTSMLVVGSGAIGCEMAFFYASMGTKITLVESLPNIAPLCDVEVSRQLDRSLRKMGIATLPSAQVHRIESNGAGCRTFITTKKGDETIDTDLVLSAAGVQPNVENIGLETIGIVTEKGKIKVDKNYCTNVGGIFAVGDVIATPALAHVATAEGVLCVERIAARSVPDINYDAVPSCIYTAPEIAWVGLTEEQAAARGIAVKTGKASFIASGKANATGARDGFVKLIADATTLQIVGAHCIGEHVTEILGELTAAVGERKTAAEVAHTIHAHPTMYEAVGEAAKEITR
jgi:dihydrolipoamide dehydrogenase